VTGASGAFAASPILETKFFAPRRRPGLVVRQRLLDRLVRGAEAKLTLISAPPGFGKTTLLAEWLLSTGDDRSVAWLSLEPSDNAPTTFWTYLLTALQRVRAESGARALALLHAGQPPPVETLLATVLNDVAADRRALVLVLDDYHTIEARAIHDGIGFLVDHMPPQMHLVLATRADPPIGLARLRARGELVEVRAADLRFTPVEAAAFLNGAMGLDLPGEAIGALETRTEGWIAALQLAALSIQGRSDAASFIGAFTGNDRYIVDYLVEEVLQRQPDRVRDFLLQTCILDRLSGPLCDAVTLHGGGAAMLETLERGNLFVIPLDDRREWFRYHHLFADVLRAHLIGAQDIAVPDLHRRASKWYEAHGERAEAIRHAFAAKDLESAASLVELAMPQMRSTRQEAALLAWLQTLPDEIIRQRPVLSLVYAGVLLQMGRLDGVEDRLRDAERWQEGALAMRAGSAGPPAGAVVVDEDEFRRLPGWIALYRAALSQAHGAPEAVIDHARRALDFIAEDDHLPRGAASALMGLASWTLGDLPTAHTAYGDGMRHLGQAGHIADAVGGSIALADIRIAQGRLGEAAATFEHGLALSAAQGEPAVRGTADMHVGLANIQRERDDLEAAERSLLRAADLGELAGFPQNPYRWRLAMARLREAQGDAAAALALLDEAERHYVSDLYPNVRPVAAVRARMAAKHGRLDEAMAWIADRKLSAGGELSYLREYEHITVAHILVDRHRNEGNEGALGDALMLLERLQAAAEAGQRAGSLIEILVVAAVARQAKGDLPAALRLLERSLGLAESEGFVRIFVDEGQPMRDLLRHAVTGDVGGAYALRLLAKLEAPGRASSGMPRAGQRGLAEPLTARELEILRFVAAGMQNQDIADHLVISLATVKRHIANTYGKLDVGNRTAAVARATELGLL